MNWADAFSGVGVVMLAILGRGVVWIMRAAQRILRNHDDFLEVLSSLAAEQGDEKWRLHRIEGRMNIEEPPPRYDTSALIDKIKARNG